MPLSISKYLHCSCPTFSIVVDFVIVAFVFVDGNDLLDIYNEECFGIIMIICVSNEFK